MSCPSNMVVTVWDTAQSSAPEVSTVSCPHCLLPLPMATVRHLPSATTHLRLPSVDLHCQPLAWFLPVPILPSLPRPEYRTHGHQQPCFKGVPSLSMAQTPFWLWFRPRPSEPTHSSVSFRLLPSLCVSCSVPAVSASLLKHRGAPTHLMLVV